MIFSFFHFFSFVFSVLFPFSFPVVFPVVVPQVDGSKSSGQTLSGRSPRAFFYIVFSILSVFVHCFLNIFIIFFFFSMCSSFFHAPDSKQIPNLLTAVAAVSWFFPIFFACIFYFSLFFQCAHHFSLIFQ